MKWPATEYRPDLPALSVAEATPTALRIVGRFPRESMRDSNDPAVHERAQQDELLAALSPERFRDPFAVANEVSRFMADVPSIRGFSSSEPNLLLLVLLTVLTIRPEDPLWTEYQAYLRCIGRSPSRLPRRRVWGLDVDEYIRQWSTDVSDHRKRYLRELEKSLLAAQEAG